VGHFTTHLTRRTANCIANMHPEYARYEDEVNRHFSWTQNDGHKMSHLYNGSSRFKDIFVSRCVNDAIFDNYKCFEQFSLLKLKDRYKNDQKWMNEDSIIEIGALDSELDCSVISRIDEDENSSSFFDYVDKLEESHTSFTKKPEIVENPHKKRGIDPNSSAKSTEKLRSNDVSIPVSKPIAKPITNDLPKYPIIPVGVIRPRRVLNESTNTSRLTNTLDSILKLNEKALSMNEQAMTLIAQQFGRK
jgi:hypothetical protein